MKVVVWVQAITVTTLPCVPVNSPIQVPPCVILCVEHRHSKLNRQGEGFTIISNRQQPSGFLSIFSLPASLQSLYLRYVNSHARTDTTVSKVTGYEPGEKGAIPSPTDILFLPQRAQWISF